MTDEPDDLARKHLKEMRLWLDADEEEVASVVEQQMLEMRGAGLRSGNPADYERHYRAARFGAPDQAERAAAAQAPVEKPRTGVEAESVASEPAVKCPKCWSTQLTANKAGYALGKAVVGGLLLGGVGLLAGFVGARDLRVTCLRCGHQWAPGEHQP